MILLLLIACGSTPREDVVEGVKQGVVYKRDMKICLNDKCAEGVMVAPKSDNYNFKVESYGNLDLFEFATCHREETTQEFATKKRWYGHKGNRKASGWYEPVPGIETDGSCPAYFSGYDKKGRHSWGFVDFVSERESLPAVLFCNGDKSPSNGVSVCQSREGLIQRIVFSEPVRKPPSKPGCSISGSGTEWVFKTPKGECVHLFQAKSGKLHRLTTLGYEAIIIREK